MMPGKTVSEMTNGKDNNFPDPNDLATFFVGS